ncbi:MAG: FadD3 family acyl-CoA ligase [Streptosporangiales bacterium]|nr:FadD3 family acyl-CoA ligase [Streptosporangiales bacterium]
MPLTDTVPDLVRSAADRFGDDEAVIDGPARITFSGLAERMEAAAGAFRSLGIRGGDRVALWAPNSAAWIVAAYGILNAGGVIVPVNTRYKAAEATDVITRSGAKLAAVQPGFLGADYEGIARSAGVPVVDLTSGFLDSGSPYRAPVKGTDPSDIFFTSGTTGRSKGVVMSHAACVRPWVEWCALTGLTRGDRYLVVNPFFHVFGYKAGCVASLIAGAAVLPVPVYEADAVLNLVEKEQVTVLPGPPALYHSLLTAAASGEKDLSSLRLAVIGAADIPVELIRRIRRDLPFQAVLTGYGLTEAGGTVTLNRREDSAADIATTAGLPCEGAEVRIDGDGEVLVRGYRVMDGYLDDPAATAEAIDPDGWLHTGDLGTLDAGQRLRITGRKKDLFFVGGFNVFPGEVEGFLLEHPAVAQAAVLGVPDDRLGSVARAFLVRAPRAGLTPEELIAWCRPRMAGYKVPRSVVFLPELPLNAAGKVDKARLAG